MPNCVPAVQNANRLAGLHYSVWGKVDFKNIVIKGFQHPISSWKICMGTLTAAQTTQPSTLASLLLPCTPLPACIKFRQVNGWGVEDKNGGEIGEYRFGGVGGIQRKRGTWKRSQSYLWRNEQEIVVWRIICGSSREQQEEKQSKPKRPDVERSYLPENESKSALVSLVSPYPPIRLKDCQRGEENSRITKRVLLHLCLYQKKRALTWKWHGLLFISSMKVLQFSLQGSKILPRTIDTVFVFVWRKDTFCCRCLFNRQCIQ